MNSGDEFIEQQLPLSERAVLPSPFAMAYRAVSDLVKEVPFLQCPPARLAAGHLVAWAADFAVSQLIEAGKLNVEGYEWAWFKKPTGKYLKIYTKKAILTISQLPDTLKQPRRAAFRVNDGYDPQSILKLFPGEKDLKAIRRPHLLLVHGYHTFDFLHVAMPNPERKPVWLGISKNILHEIHDVSAGLTPAEGPKTIDAMTIKEHLKREIRDNHG